MKETSQPVDLNQLRESDDQCGGLGTTDETFGVYNLANPNRLNEPAERNPDQNTE